MSSTQSTSGAPSITRTEIEEALDRGEPLLLLEALPEPYYRRGHLPGARHFPLDQARALAPALAPRKESAIVVYCASVTCRNSHAAAVLLRGLGYENVRVYAGGKQDWQDAGLPLEA
jgi:rhodanese-related sulfurtransferase